MKKIALLILLTLSTVASISQTLPNHYRPFSVKPSFMIGAVGNLHTGEWNWSDVENGGWYLTNIGVSIMYTGHYRFGVYGDFRYGNLTRWNLGMAVKALPFMKFYVGYGGVSYNGFNSPLHDYKSSITFGTIIGFPVGPGIQLGVDFGNPYSSTEISLSDAMPTIGINFSF